MRWPHKCAALVPRLCLACCHVVGRHVAWFVGHASAQPLPLPAAAKRLAIIDSEDDFEDEASGPRRRRGRSGSAGGSSSLSGSEEEGSEGEESGLASDLSGDDSHDMEGGCRAVLCCAVLWCAVL